MELTSEQRAIVDALTGPVLVMAGVGCGKTRVLAERAANALDRGQSPESMLALTFTNRAAREMRERLDAIVGPQAASGTLVTTFHALCVRILRRDGKALAIDPSFAIWDESDSREAVKLAAAQLGRHLDDRAVRRFADRIGDWKQQRRYPQNLRDASAPDLELYRAYQHLLETSNALDFDDLVAQVWTLFKKFDPVRQAWAERCQWVEIDEFQDTSDLEYDILHLLTRGHRNVCAFGDTNQWIYRWRGVDGRRIVARFQQDFPGLKRLPLPRNFRSTPVIQAAAHWVLHPGDPPPALAAESRDLAAVALRACRDEIDERDYLVQRLRELHSERIPWRRIAVLTRTNRDLQSLADAVSGAGIPAATVAASEFFRRTEVKDLAAYLRLVADEHDALALRRIANVPARNLPTPLLNQVEERGRPCGLLLTDLLDEATLADGDPCAWELDVAGREFVALDCEATGLDLEHDEPVSLAAVRVDGRTGERVEFERLLRPSRGVGASREVHGYRDAQLAAEGVHPAEGLAELRTFIGRRPLVGHNIVNYDLPLLNRNLQQHGLPPLRQREADTLWLARRALEVDRYDLGRVRDACRVAAPATHRALDDANCAADCFRVLVARLTETAPERGALVREVGPRFAPLARLVGDWRLRGQSSPLSALIEGMLEESGYLSLLRRDGREGQRRLDTLRQLRELVLARFDPLPPDRALRAFLDYLSLAKSADRIGEEEDRVLLLTIHTAKGLEFDAVLIAGAHDGGIPAYWARDQQSIAEEQRLLYVGMTRARQVLELTYPARRVLPNGTEIPCRPSRFLRTMPVDLLRDRSLVVR